MLLPPGAWLMTLMRNRHQQLRSAPAPLSASCARAAARPHARAGPAKGRRRRAGMARTGALPGPVARWGRNALARACTFAAERARAAEQAMRGRTSVSKAGGGSRSRDRGS